MNRGFSLVELLISLVVSAVILVSILKLFNEFNIANFRFLGSTDHLYEISRAFDLIQRDLDDYARLNGHVSEDKISFKAHRTDKLVNITYYIQEKRLVRRVNNGYNTAVEFKENARFDLDGDILSVTIDGYSLAFKLSGSDDDGI